MATHSGTVDVVLLNPANVGPVFFSDYTGTFFADREFTQCLMVTSLGGGGGDGIGFEFILASTVGGSPDPDELYAIVIEDELGAIHTLYTADCDISDVFGSVLYDWDVTDLPFSGSGVAGWVADQQYAISFLGPPGTVALNRLTWTAAVPGDAPIAGYRLYNADNDELVFDSLSPSVLTYDHGPLDPGTYRYSVVAYAEDALVSPVSNIVELIIEAPPAAPEFVFVAASMGGGGGVDPTGFVSYSSPIFPSTPTGPDGTLVSGSLGGYTDVGIKTFLNGVPEIVMVLRVPTAELLPSPQTAYFTSLDIAGITVSSLLSAVVSSFTTDTSQPGFTQLLWNWGPAEFDLTHLSIGPQYTASFVLP